MALRTRVLIVEDDNDLRYLFRVTLSLAGFDVSEAGTGLEALERIDHNPPDIVVLDLGLPEISGLVVREQIAAHAHTRDVPVVVVTGSDASLDGLDVRCVLRKPVSPPQLVRAVKACLTTGSGSTGV
jgi:CheY-like chemotaxis protein